MKYIFTTVLSLLFSIAFAQYIEVKNMNYMFAKVNNELKVSNIDNLAECKIFNQGTPIEFEIKNNQTIIAKPQRPTNRNGVMVFITNPNGDTVLSQKIVIKRIPNPKASFLGQRCGVISHQRLIKGNKLDAKFDFYKIDCQPNVYKFSLIIIKSDGTKINLVNDNKSEIFTDEIKKALAQTKTDDLILFKDIKVRMPGGSSVLSPLIFKVK